MPRNPHIRLAELHRLSLAPLHMRSAIIFATQSTGAASALDNSADDGPLDDIVEERALLRKAAVIAAIYTSTAAAEAFINELFLDAVDAMLLPWGLTDATRVGIVAAWPNLTKVTMLDKYKTALAVSDASATAFTGGHLWDTMAVLVKLRNVLTHYTPTTIVVQSDIASLPVTEIAQQKTPAGQASNEAWATRTDNLTELLAHLKRQKILGRSAVSLESCLIPPCADWAVRTSLAFVSEFCRLLPCGSPLAGIHYQAT